MRWHLPRAAPGQVVGLFGGSFNPPHVGHAHLSREALKRLRLDRLWWLVSPGNPLKPDAPAPLAERMAAAHACIDHPRVVITDIEAHMGTRTTIDTLTHLQRLYPGTRFIWLMGADNLAGFHRWDRWQEIFARVPIAVFARPGQRLAALNSPAVRRFEQSRLAAGDAALLGRRVPPAWVWLDMRMRPESSTALRLRARLGANGGGACRNAGKGTGD